MGEFESLNPDKGYNVRDPQEAKDAVSRGGKGIKRTEESKERYRLSKLGEKNPRCILTDEQVRLIINEYAEGNQTYRSLAIKFSVSVSTIQGILGYKRRNYVILAK